MQVSRDPLYAEMKQAVGHRSIQKRGGHPSMKNAVITLKTRVRTECRPNSAGFPADK